MWEVQTSVGDCNYRFIIALIILVIIDCYNLLVQTVSSVLVYVSHGKGE